MIRILSGERRDFWARVVRCMLMPLMLLFYIAICVRYLLYKVKLLKTKKIEDLRIICIGNLSSGGTGKTPAVALICKMLADAGQKIAVVSRGYHKSSVEQLNDEGRLLKNLLPDVPHYQNKNRYKACIKARDNGATCVLLDDGFSHLKLARNLNIVLIDTTRPFGFCELLPRGLLREPPSSLKRADAVILTRVNQTNEQNLQKLKAKIEKHIKPSVKIFTAVHQPMYLKSVFEDAQTAKIRTLEEIREKSALLFAGTGNPQAVLKTCQQLNLEIKDFLIFPDHHNYETQDFLKIINQATDLKVDFMLTTSKDAVKISDFQGEMKIPMYSLEIEFKILDEQAFKYFLQQDL